ncbi:putative this magnesium-dependent enzyme catalyzes the hydrolysis of ATP coupled with the transport of calcium [Lyophyllum shimeji]|uniref:This magnesium-dependent enzyme catalyzes the hydrolysis of ATP coupled with the transport of calcium n=1 Tax=Lyophyllum shimeji TaxID=47721 RepID=A0A9P3PH53_LYOSH|nr:putative this magnesium-dependent enzyme catalyzes the hydrolysis of ATP coupled with the transport of calcium [Lyophyllum shimeji]
MSVSHFLVIDGATGAPSEYTVEGTTYAPFEPVQRLAEIAAICNDAKIVYNAEKDTYINVGEPTEAALKVLVEKIGCRDAEVTKSLSSLSKAARANAMMSVLVKLNGSGALFVKGAPESVLERCTSVLAEGKTIPLTPALRSTLLERTSSYGSNGLRTLALAFVNVQDIDSAHYHSESTRDYARFEQNLTFVSIVGMLDPPRPEEIKGTAETICRQIGIFGPDEDLTGKSYTGRELDELTHEEKVAAVKRASLFTRTEPGHKSQLVDLLQGLGMVVAMTGDGVNDAPALKKADIGVAMGSGTDVAKLAADMVLADSNFATIEQAVEEGRLIYNNTKQFIRYLISSNIGEVVSIFLTVLLGMPEALIPVQLLWVNLVTDSLPATALGFNPADHSIMRVPPRNSREPLVGKWLFLRYLVIGTYVGCATVFGYAWWFLFYSGGPQISFYQLTHFHQCSVLFPRLVVKSPYLEKSFPRRGHRFEHGSSLHDPLRPFFTTLFAITPSTGRNGSVLFLSLPVIVIDELLKFLTTTFVDPPSKIKLD